jgi:glycosyltransferase involved in cell wall biosynthesis
MWPILSPGARLFEALRRLQSTLARITPSIRQCARKSTRVLASNPDTAALLQRLGTPPANLTQLSAAFFTQDQTNHFTPAQRPSGPLRLFAGGQIEGRKGISLALDALSLLHRQGIPFHYTIAGHGPEIPRLREKTNQLGLAASISFPGALRGDEYLNALQQSHAYLLPSLRDSAGLTLMEAMLCGCVPIVADCGGPGAIVTPACGFKIPVTTPEKMTHQIANALRQLANQSANPPASQAARERILSSFSETNYRTRIQSLYNEIH